MPDFEKEIKDNLVINEDNLDVELRDHATKLFYYSSLWARAVKAERQQKLEVESLDAALSQEFRKLMLENSPGERVTERMLKEYIAGHPAFKEAQLKLIQLGMAADMFGVAKTAFESRGRMLQELAKSYAENKFYTQEYANMRAEFERREEEKTRKRKPRKADDVSVIDVD